MPEHNIPPVYNKNSTVLILGSFPSVKSREEAFFYAHPQNRFWRMMADVFERQTPVSVEEKKELLLSNGIALWDVAACCEIRGSADASMKDVRPNDIIGLMQKCSISKILLNGKTAEKYFKKFFQKTVSVPIYCLPSTSPANAKTSYGELLSIWKAQLKDE